MRASSRDAAAIARESVSNGARARARTPRTPERGPHAPRVTPERLRARFSRLRTSRAARGAPITASPARRPRAGCHDIFFVFSIWRARRRRSGARAPPRRLPVAPETRSIERSRANRAASGREPERLTRTLSDRTPRPHPICCRLVRPETGRLPRALDFVAFVAFFPLLRRQQTQASPASASR